MRLDQLVKIQTRGKKRLGRGLGSGKGKTGGRGTKGQKARGSMPVGFVGDSPLYKKLPRRRGMGNVKISVKPKTINLSSLAIFKAKTIIDTDQLLKSGLIKPKDLKFGVKILGSGELKNALTVKLPTSESARQKIESKGGKVEDV